MSWDKALFHFQILMVLKAAAAKSGFSFKVQQSFWMPFALYTFAPDDRNWISYWELDKYFGGEHTLDLFNPLSYGEIFDFMFDLGGLFKRNHISHISYWRKPV